MSFINKNPITATSIKAPPLSPPNGTRGIFPMSDGWYDIDDQGNIKKIGGSGSGGTTDHAQLTNLDYDNSGHIGFQKQFTEAEQAWFNIIPSIYSTAETALNGLNDEIAIREEKDTEIKLTADTALSIAKGANQALVFDDYEAMWSYFVPLEKDKYIIGQNVLIRTLEVPDLWISEMTDSQADDCITSEGVFCADAAFVELLKTNGKVQIGYYVFSALETQKVDLTGYATKEEVNELEARIDELTPNSGDISDGGVYHLEANSHYVVGFAYVNEQYELILLGDAYDLGDESSIYIKPCDAETLVLTDTTGAVYFGDDCDETGTFTPQPNTHYEISFKRMGDDDSGNPLIIARVGAWQ